MNFALLSTTVAAIVLIIKGYVDGHFSTTIDADTRSLIYSILGAVIGVVLALGAYYNDPSIVAGMTNPYFYLIAVGIASSIPGGVSTSLLTLLGIKVSSTPAVITTQSVTQRKTSSFNLWM